MVRGPRKLKVEFESASLDPLSASPAEKAPERSGRATGFRWPDPRGAWVPRLPRVWPASNNTLRSRLW